MQSTRFAMVIIGCVLLVGCATLPENADRPVSFAYTDTARKKVYYDWGDGEVLYDRPEKILQDTDQKRHPSGHPDQSLFPECPG